MTCAVSYLALFVECIGRSRPSAILDLDIDGVADVHGVRIERARDTLGDLELEDWLRQL